MSTTVLHDNLHDLGIGTRKIMRRQAQAAERDHALRTACISKLAFYFFTFQGFSAFSGFHKKSKVRK